MTSEFRDRWKVGLVNEIIACETVDGLDAINQPTSQLVIWKRSLSTDLRDWIEQLEAPLLPNFRILVKPCDLRPAIEATLDRSGLASCDMRDLLIHDVGTLVSTFAKITNSDCVDVRLERIEHDACWKFHRDVVATRLVTTYRGPSTEWVQMAQAEHALRDQTLFAGPLERLGDHDVAIFKGSRSGPNGGVVHRSPPIADTGQARLLLCLNQKSVVSPNLWLGA